MAFSGIQYLKEIEGAMLIYPLTLIRLSAFTKINYYTVVVVVGTVVVVRSTVVVSFPPTTVVDEEEEGDGARVVV